MLRTIFAGALATTLLFSCTSTPAPTAARAQPPKAELRQGQELRERDARRRALNKRRSEDRLRDSLQRREQESRSAPDFQ